MPICHKCHKGYDGWEACPHCGEPYQPQPVFPPNQRRSFSRNGSWGVFCMVYARVVILLALCLGWFLTLASMIRGYAGFAELLRLLLATPFMLGLAAAMDVAIDSANER